MGAKEHIFFQLSKLFDEKDTLCCTNTLEVCMFYRPKDGFQTKKQPHILADTGLSLYHLFYS